MNGRRRAALERRLGHAPVKRKTQCRRQNSRRPAPSCSTLRTQPERDLFEGGSRNEADLKRGGAADCRLRFRGRVGARQRRLGGRRRRIRRERPMAWIATSADRRPRSDCRRQARRERQEAEAAKRLPRLAAPTVTSADRRPRIVRRRPSPRERRDGAENLARRSRPRPRKDRQATQGRPWPRRQRMGRRRSGRATQSCSRGRRRTASPRPWSSVGQ
jgi:hypothetical protein